MSAEKEWTAGAATAATRRSAPGRRSWWCQRTGPSVPGRRSAVAILIAGLAACTPVATVFPTPTPTSVAASALPSSTPTSREGLDRTFVDAELTFRYAWPLAPSIWDDVSTITWPIVYLTSQPTHDPCSTATASNGQITSTSCGDPITGLAPGGSLVHWYNSNLPGSRLVDQPGTDAVVGGHPARVLISAADGGCRRLGGRESVQATVDAGRPSPVGVFIHLDACLTRSGQTASVLAMLRTLRVLTAPQ